MTGSVRRIRVVLPRQLSCSNFDPPAQSEKCKDGISTFGRNFRRSNNGYCHLLVFYHSGNCFLFRVLMDGVGHYRIQTINKWMVLILGRSQIRSEKSRRVWRMARRIYGLNSFGWKSQCSSNYSGWMKNALIATICMDQGTIGEMRLKNVFKQMLMIQNVNGEITKKCIAYITDNKTAVSSRFSVNDFSFRS